MLKGLKTGVTFRVRINFFVFFLYPLLFFAFVVKLKKMLRTTVLTEIFTTATRHELNVMRFNINIIKCRGTVDSFERLQTLLL